MNSGWGRSIKGGAVAVAVLSPIASHAALAMGRGYGTALAFSAIQAVAIGVVLWRALPAWRWVGVAAAGVLLTGLMAGLLRSAADGLLVSAGLTHALMYGVLLAVFAASLRPGRTSLVTRMARRLNPSFHDGMVPYTRAVAWAWCAFFMAQLLASAVLLATAPLLWRALVTTVHAPLVLLMALAEFAVRRWRWRHERYTSLRDTLRGMRGLSAAAEGARTSTPDADCP